MGCIYCYTMVKYWSSIQTQNKQMTDLFLTGSMLSSPYTGSSVLPHSLGRHSKSVVSDLEDASMVLNKIL